MILTLLIINALQGDLYYVPKTQVRYEEENYIPYQLTPFRIYPFGREMGGVLKVLNTQGCEALNVSEYRALENMPSFILVEEGECSTKVKIDNAIKEGGNLMIVYKNLNSKDDQLLEFDNSTST